MLDAGDRGGGPDPDRLALLFEEVEGDPPRTIFASWLIDDRGLADAAPILAVVFLVSIAAAMPGLWPSPAHRGLTPFGEPPESDPAAAGVDYETAIGTRFFRILVPGFILAMGAQVGALSQIAKLGTEYCDAIVEDDTIGGECPNYGCVPTKALLKAAEIYDEAKHGAEYGRGSENLAVRSGGR